MQNFENKEKEAKYVSKFDKEKETVKYIVDIVDNKVKTNIGIGYPSLIDVLTKSLETQMGEDEFVIKAGRNINGLVNDESDLLDANEKTVLLELMNTLVEEDTFKFLSWDKTGFISEVSDDLFEAQKQSRIQQKLKTSIIEEKTALFSAFGIKHDGSKIDDQLGINYDSIKKCVYDHTENNTRINKEEYKKLYKQGLTNLLDMVKKNNPNAFSNNENGNITMDYVMNKYEGFVSPLCKYYFEKDEVLKYYNAPKFGGLSTKEIKHEFESRFSPKYHIIMNEDMKFVHDNNHVDRYTDTNRSAKYAAAKKCFDDILNQYDNLPKENQKEYQINALLNIREPYLMITKAYKSFGFLRRFFKVFDKECRSYQTKAEQALDELVQKIGVSKDYAKKFLNNKVKDIKIDGKVIKYNDVYTENLGMYDSLNKLDRLETEAINQIDVKEVYNPKNNLEVNDIVKTTTRNLEKK